jgi:hypothetical protein
MTARSLPLVRARDDAITGEDGARLAAKLLPMGVLGIPSGCRLAPRRATTMLVSDIVRVR